MATTTNYGWTTPDDTALVKDGAAAIRTLGTSVDTTTKALNPSTTLGDIEYRSSTANTNTRLAIGSSGQVLTVSGAGIPSWATASAGGMTLISTTSLTGASVTISTIPQTFNHLQLVLRNPLPATDVVAPKLRFNNDSNTRYRAFGYDGITAAAMNATQGNIQGEADNAVSTFNLSVVNIYDYANTTTAKFYYYQSMTTNYTTTTSVNLETGFTVYNQTGGITDITLFPGTGNWTSGSVLLYGVK